MSNRIEFYPIDVGAQHLGATSFSIYNTSAPEAIQYILANSGARVLVCEAQYVDTVRRSGATLDTIVVVDAQPSAQQSGTLTLEQMKSSAAADFDFESTWRATTHACLLFETTAVSAVLPVEFGDRITSYMPSAHIADRLTCLYMQMVFGTQITVVPDPSQVAAALPDC
eukprot:gene27657-33421_t